jgi:hypothetical protein
MSNISIKNNSPRVYNKDNKSFIYKVIDYIKNIFSPEKDLYFVTKNNELRKKTLNKANKVKSIYNTPSKISKKYIPLKNNEYKPIIMHNDIIIKGNNIINNKKPNILKSNNKKPNILKSNNKKPNILKQNRPFMQRSNNPVKQVVNNNISNISKLEKII